MSSGSPQRRFRESFGSLNNLNSNPFSNREKILDLSLGIFDPFTQLAQSMLQNSYTIDSLKSFGNTFNARVLGVITGKPARHQYPELYSNSTSVGPDGSVEVPEYYLFVLRDETDHFLPNPDTFISNIQSYVSLAMMQGSAISDKPVAESLETFGEGDIVEVFKPNQNSWNGAKVKKVVVRNNFDVVLPEGASALRAFLGGGGGGALGPFSRGGPVTGAPFEDQGMSPSSPFLFPTDPDWTSRYKPGIDVSSFQTPSALNWQVLYEEGIRWVIIKSSEGSGRLSRVYETAVQHTVNVLNSGLPIRIGYYHYCRADLRPRGADYRQDAISEASRFLFEVNDIMSQAQQEVGMSISNNQLLPLAIDIEFKGGLNALKPSIWPGRGRTSEYQQSEENGLTREQLQEWVQLFADKIEEVREPPMFYIGPNLTGPGLGFTNAETTRSKFQDASKQWTRSALWTAHYPSRNPSQNLIIEPSPRSSSNIPGPWAFSTWTGPTPFTGGPIYNAPPLNGPSSNWVIWQFTGKGKLRGNTAGTDIDLNVAKTVLFDQTRYPVRTGNGNIPASPGD